jgi:hypothetical protein
MQFRYSLPLTVLALSVCVVNPAAVAGGLDRVPVNTPALMADLQAVRTAAEMRTLQDRHAMQVTLTVAKALELYVPASFAVFPEAGIDLSRTLQLDRSRTWSDALPAALRSAGIDARLDPANKTIHLAPAKVNIPTFDG